MGRMNDFITYLYAQIKQPYIWGGQHTELTRKNYKTVIRKVEKNTGGYSDGESYADAAIKYCEAIFNENPDINILYAYDCSGLGMYWLYNLTHTLKTDMTAQRMAGECIITSEPPKTGYWLFRFNANQTKISHIGYMVDNKYLIEAKGRRYGVIKTLFRKSQWDLIGIPKCFLSEINKSIKIIGGFVNIRDRDNKTGKVIKTAKRGEIYPCIGVAPSGWYEIYIPDMERIGYISNRDDLTVMI